MPRRSLLRRIQSRLIKPTRMVPQPYVLGIEVMDDIQKCLPYYPIQTILDVGANIGKSAIRYRQKWPSARIESFEPFQHAYRILCENTQVLNVRCHNIALGSYSGYLDVQISAEDKHSSRNSLIPENNIHDITKLKTERIQMTTLSEFCVQQNIPFIDFLKIDTEGYDLEVLKGGASLLQSASVFMIQTEVSMNPMNTFHMGLEPIYTYLEKLGYMLFGIYSQVHEWNPKRPILRRADAVFICERLVTPERLQQFRDAHATLRE